MQYLSVTLTATAIKVLFHADNDVQQLPFIVVPFNVTQTSKNLSRLNENFDKGREKSRFTQSFIRIHVMFLKKLFTIIFQNFFWKMQLATRNTWFHSLEIHDVTFTIFASAWQNLSEKIPRFPGVTYLALNVHNVYAYSNTHAYLNLFISSARSEYSYTLTVSVTIALDPTINQATNTGFTNVRAHSLAYCWPYLLTTDIRSSVEIIELTATRRQLGNGHRRNLSVLPFPLFCFFKAKIFSFVPLSQIHPFFFCRARHELLIKSSNKRVSVNNGCSEGSGAGCVSLLRFLHLSTLCHPCLSITSSCFSCIAPVSTSGGRR